MTRARFAYVSDLEILEGLGFFAILCYAKKSMLEDICRKWFAGLHSATSIIEHFKKSEELNIKDIIYLLGPELPVQLALSSFWALLKCWHQHTSGLSFHIVIHEKKIVGREGRETA